MTAFPGYGLDGRVAIVTGASSGIGAAIAEAMAQAARRSSSSDATPTGWHAPPRPAEKGKRRALPLT